MVMMMMMTMTMMMMMTMMMTMTMTMMMMMMTMTMTTTCGFHLGGRIPRFDPFCLVVLVLFRYMFDKTTNFWTIVFIPTLTDWKPGLVAVKKCQNPQQLEEPYITFS